METREELINGLRYVKTQIEQILAVTNRQVEIVADFREEKEIISTSDTKGKLKIALICLYAVFVFDNIIISVACHSPTYFFIALACGIFMYVSRKKEQHKKLQKIGMAAIVLYMVYCLFLVLASRIIIAIILTLIMIAATIYVVIKAIKMRNEKVIEENAKTVEYNAQVQQEYDETVEELDKLKNDLYAQSGSWYPKDYYSLEAANFFLSAVENYKADTIKEIVLLFDDTQYKTEMLNSQRAIQSMSEQQIINQEAMMKQMKLANVLSIANIALQIGTIGAINSNTSAVNSNAYATRSAVSNAVNQVNSSINKATDAARSAEKASKRAADAAYKAWKK